jgi:hypothetical protein
MAKQPVTFKVEPAVKRLLEHNAQQAGLRLDPYMRQWVTNSLAENPIDDIREQQTQTRQELEELRDDLAKTLEVMLIATGISAEDARESVRTLRRKRPLKKAPG